jgi:hypothetical protein
MDVVYATHLPLPHSDLDTSIADATVAVASWVKDTFGVSLLPLVGGTHIVENGTVTWSVQGGDSGQLISVAVDVAEFPSGVFRWRTLVDVGREDGRGWARVRHGVYTPVEGLISRPRLGAPHPDVVRRIVNAVAVRIDDLPVALPWELAPDDVGQLAARLSDPARLLPVLVLAPTRAPVPLDPARLHDRLLGLAHVVVLPSSALPAWDRAVVEGEDARSGQVHLYWPSVAADESGILLAVRESFDDAVLIHLGEDRLAAYLSESIGRVAAAAIGEPALTGRLRRERHLADLSARAAETQEARARLATLEATSIDAMTWQVFTAEFDTLASREQDTREELELVGLEIEEVRGQLDNAAAQLRQMWLTGPPSADQEPTDERVPGSVLEAVLIAAESCPHLVFLPEAFTSATASTYQSPVQVLADLRAIEQVGQLWSADHVPGGLVPAFVTQLGSAFRGGISNHAAQQFGTDYEREYQGQRVTLGPHVARGRGPAASILRLYWYTDTARRCFVIGHVGRKLRDASNH